MGTIFRVLIAGAALVACGVAYLRWLPANDVAVGEPVRQDDFLYTVKHVEKRPANGAVAYVVTIRVDNQAKRVDYQWRDDSVFVTDALKRHYRPIAPAQAAGREHPPIAAGSFAEYTVTFALPADAAHPMLHYWNGLMMGDIFNFGAYGRASIAL